MSEVVGHDEPCDHRCEGTANRKRSDAIPQELEPWFQAIGSELVAEMLQGTSVPGSGAAVVARRAGRSWAGGGRPVWDVIPPLRSGLTRLIRDRRVLEAGEVVIIVERVLQAFFTGFHEHVATRCKTVLTTTFVEVAPAPSCLSTWEVSTAAQGRVLRLGDERSGRLLVAGGLADAAQILSDCCSSTARRWTGAVTSECPRWTLTPGELARRIAVIVRALGFPPGLYRRGHVLLELLAAQDDEVAHSLIPAVVQVAANETLLETLKVLFHANGNRNEASRRLVVHRSTLDYRLTRIAALSGWDPASQLDLMSLRAGLAAFSVRRAPLDEHDIACPGSR